MRWPFGVSTATAGRISVRSGPVRSGPGTGRSGYGAHTTAAEVLDGIDLTGRTVLVTGGYSGIGTEVVGALHAAGAPCAACSGMTRG